MRWLSAYLGAVALLDVLFTIVLAIVVGLRARGRGRVLGATGFVVIALSGVLSALLSGIVNLVASNGSDMLAAIAVVNVLVTILFLVGLVMVVAGVLSVAGSSSDPSRSIPAPPGPAGYGPRPPGPVT